MRKNEELGFSYILHSYSSQKGGRLRQKKKTIKKKGQKSSASTASFHPPPAFPSSSTFFIHPSSDPPSPFHHPPPSFPFKTKPQCSHHLQHHKPDPPFSPLHLQSRAPSSLSPPSSVPLDLNRRPKPHRRPKPSPEISHQPPRPVDPRRNRRRRRSEITAPLFPLPSAQTQEPNLSLLLRTSRSDLYLSRETNQQNGSEEAIQIRNGGDSRLSDQIPTKPVRFRRTAAGVAQLSTGKSQIQPRSLHAPRAFLIRPTRRRLCSTFHRTPHHRRSPQIRGRSGPEEVPNRICCQIQA